MKSVVNQPNECKKEKEFPKLMISGNVIVLFEEEDCGVVVSDKEKSVQYHIGHHSKNWNTREFTDFEGSVTLSND